MKLFLSLVIVVTSISTLSFNDAQAQTRTKVQAQVRTLLKAPAKLISSDQKVTVIKPADIRRTSEATLGELAVPNSASTSRTRMRTRNAAPKAGMMGTIQQAPQGKLKVTLTPKTPAVNNRAYLSVFYPQSMPLSNNRDFVSFGEFYVPGHMNYSVRLDKGKKYLVEIIAGGWNSNGGSVKHSIGGEDSTHEFAEHDDQHNISRIVEVSESGWVSGKLEAADPAPYQWRVFSVSINEMD